VDIFFFPSVMWLVGFGLDLCIVLCSVWSCEEGNWGGGEGCFMLAGKDFLLALVSQILGT